MSTRNTSAIGAHDALISRPLEIVFVVAALFFFTDAVRVLIQNPGGEGVVSFSKDSVSFPGMVAIYATAAGALAFYWKEAITRARDLRGIAPLVLLVVSSFLWSSDGRVTLKNAVWFLGSSLFGFYLHSRFSSRQQLHLLGAALLLVTISSYVFVVFLPDLGVDPGLHADSWRGVFIHKNSLGRLATLSVIVFALLAASATQLSLLLVCFSAGAVGLLIMSRSATALIAFFLCVPIAAIAALLRKRRVSVIASVMVLVALSVLGVVAAVSFGEPILALLGKDGTLTGRSTLWAAVLLEILERPWLGYGYHAFWNGGSAEYLNVWSLVNWAPPHAHNGSLDVLLQFGVIGLFVFVVTYTVAFFRSLRLARLGDRGTYAAWPMLFLGYYFFTNLAESTFFRHTSVFWVLFVTVLCRLASSEERTSFAVRAIGRDSTAGTPPRLST